MPNKVIQFENMVFACIDSAAPYSTTQHQLANYRYNSLDDFLGYAKEHVPAKYWDEYVERCKAHEKRFGPF